MEIFKVLQNKNKIVSVFVEDKSCNSLEGLQLHEQETPTQVFSCEYSKVLGTAFRTTLMAALELNFSIIKEFKKESQWRECLCFN